MNEEMDLVVDEAELIEYLHVNLPKLGYAAGAKEVEDVASLLMDFLFDKGMEDL